MDTSFLLIRDTGRKDEFGARIFRTSRILNGKVKGTVEHRSGVPTNQVLRTAGDPASQPGSLEPIPEGRYTVRAVEWKGGRGNWAASWGDGLGPWVAELVNGQAMKRGDFFYHMDANRRDRNGNPAKPGTAGCPGFVDHEDGQEFLDWQFTGPVYVDHGLGTVQVPPFEDEEPWEPEKFKVSVHDGKIGATGKKGAPLLSGRFKLEWHDGHYACWINDQPVPLEALSLVATLGPAPPAAPKPSKLPWVLKSQLADADSPLAISIGCAEGNRQPNGGKNPAYFGHTDPGNARHNQGTFSYQGTAASPAEADAIWLKLMRQLLPTWEAKAKAAGLEFEEPLLATSMFDLYTQAPKAVTAKGGFWDLLPPLAARGVNEESIIWARVHAFWDPDRQAWDCPGFDNDPARLTDDQHRRTEAIQEALRFHQLLK